MRWLKSGLMERNPNLPALLSGIVPEHGALHGGALVGQ